LNKKIIDEFTDIPCSVTRYRLRHPERAAEGRKRYSKQRWAKLTKAEKREERLKKDYGLTFVDLDRMFVEQNGLCEICKTEISLIDNSLKACVDHNHVTKQIRGLLCGNCNWGLGHIKESREIAISMIKYIDKYNNVVTV
jgi:hypothetical protein